MRRERRSGQENRELTSLQTGQPGVPQAGAAFPQRSPEIKPSLVPRPDTSANAPHARPRGCGERLPGAHCSRLQERDPELPPNSPGRVRALSAGAQGKAGSRRRRPVGS